MFEYADDAERRETDYSKKPRCDRSMYGKPCTMHRGHDGWCFVVLDDSRYVRIYGDP
jgi:hypothetical protein